MFNFGVEYADLTQCLLDNFKAAFTHNDNPTIPRVRHRQTCVPLLSYDTPCIHTCESGLTSRCYFNLELPTIANGGQLLNSKAKQERVRQAMFTLTINSQLLQSRSMAQVSCPFVSPNEKIIIITSNIKIDLLVLMIIAVSKQPLIKGNSLHMHNY